jgi:GNAT superfamily N-acetyltransferase
VSTEPSFRLATESDLPCLLQFMRDYYACDGHLFREQEAPTALTALLRDPSLGQAWLVLNGEAPVGYVVLCFGYSLEWLGRDAFIDELYLREDYRGRGWGRKTMEFIEQAARDLGIKTLHLEVVHRNTTASALYQKVGFVEHRSILMSKPIA